MSTSTVTATPSDPRAIPAMAAPERTALVAEGDTEAGVAVSLIVVPEGVVVLFVIDLVVCSSVEDCE